MKKLVAVLCAMNVALMIGWTYDRSYHQAHPTQSSKGDIVHVSNKETVIEGDLRVKGKVFAEGQILGHQLFLEGGVPGLVINHWTNFERDKKTILYVGASGTGHPSKVSIDGNVYMNGALISSP